ncbi:pyridoxamine 5'-phosphate oxidase family protein [Actinomadura sp. 9N215]|uniref:pyridoxamine 5'-phosphate oxidase family protein n=1 Tax=Actinomadura sp. 9N215 TaxID=3375150 RepID=UPI0037BAB079
MVPPETLAVLIEHGRFATHATHTPGGVWVSTINFLPLWEPLRLLWYSPRRARHSCNIATTPEVAASIFRTDLPNEVGLDGAQFTGAVRAIENADELAERAKQYNTRNFPDEQVRAQWRPPPTWLATKNDQRLAASQQQPQESAEAGR